jgi:hypothetical protein
MSHIRVLVCRVDDPASDQMTELAAFDLPTPDVAALQPTTALDDLETVTHETGNRILRQVLQAQWGLIDSALVERHRQLCYPQPVTADGYEPVTVASRFGTMTLSRQVCQQGDPSTHVLPGNGVTLCGVWQRFVRNWAISRSWLSRIAFQCQETALVSRPLGHLVGALVGGKS